ncbi:MAG TPA: fimbria/pilus periplasmic chaperone [Burkholderiaceae bacterium]
MQVSNVLLEFQGVDTAQGLWLSNSGDVTLRAQARVLQWTQVDGEEQLQPTRDLTVSPPILEIAPGQQQFVRVIRLQPGVPTQEQAYRLWVDELPSDAASASSASPGVQLLIRHSVPVFVLPKGGEPLGGRRGVTDTAPIAARFLANAAGDTRLEVHNSGQQRVRLSQLVFMDPQNQSVSLVPGLLGYVLAGQQMHWAIKLSPAQLHSGGSLKARLNDDMEPQTLAVVPALH